MLQITMLLVLVWLVLSGQGNNGANSSEVQKHSCGFFWGKRIAHTSGSLLFCVPHGIKVSRAAGFEGDIRDNIRLSDRGETGELIILSGVGPSGFRKPPEAGGHSTVYAWRCSEGDGRDLRIERDGRCWRMITFPLGYAEYGDVPANIATRFDRVLDSLCCRPIKRPTGRRPQVRGPAPQIQGDRPTRRY